MNVVIPQINTALPADERDALTLFISASMEGMTVFADHGKPYRGNMPMLTRIALRSFVQLVRDVKPGDMLG